MSHPTLVGAIQAKFWGQTQCLFCGPSSEVHYLQIKKGGYCSKHKHYHKWNRFFIISGKLEVTIFKKNGEDKTILEPGHYTDLPPGEYHRFNCLEDCECLEIYWVDGLDPKDISRKDIGGMSIENTDKLATF